jgi:hypothetical protein
VGLPVGFAVVGTGVGYWVGEILGLLDVEGTAVGFIVGETLGLPVVGETVGVAVDGTGVGFFVGVFVGLFVNVVSDDATEDVEVPSPLVAITL